MIRVKAPGKLLLMGEHSVVYGHPCIVTAVDKYLQVRVEAVDTSTVEIDAPQVKDTRFIEEAVRVFVQHIQKPIKGISISTHSDFPATWGFGSSSAVVVAVLKALSLYVGITITPEQIFLLGFRVIQEVQKVGSGFDIAAATYGGTMMYQTEGPKIQPFAHGVDIVVGYSGVKADTVSLINDVRKKREEYPEKVDRIFSGITKLVEQAKQAIEEQDVKRLGKYITYNQEYLRDLGVSTEKLEHLISAAMHAGAYGAKLSGAGGGDCMIAVVEPDTRSAVEEAIKKAGGEVIQIWPHAAGVHQVTDNEDEQFIVVDENDEVVGYASRRECHENASMIHRSANVVLFDDTNRVLLQKRSMTKDTNPGWWTISVSGHVTKGETYEEAAMREMREELGITTSLLFHERFLFRYTQESEMETIFTGKYNGPFSPSKTEVDTVEFFSQNDLKTAMKSKSIIITPFAETVLTRIGFL